MLLFRLQRELEEARRQAQEEVEKARREAEQELSSQKTGYEEKLTELEKNLVNTWQKIH